MTNQEAKSSPKIYEMWRFAETKLNFENWVDFVFVEYKKVNVNIYAQKGRFTWVTQLALKDLEAGIFLIEKPVNVVSRLPWSSQRKATRIHCTLNVPTTTVRNILWPTRKEKGETNMPNIYGNQSVKCNGCNSMYCTPEEKPTKCDQCGSEDIVLLTDAEATQLTRDTFRRSPESGAAPRQW